MCENYFSQELTQMPINPGRIPQPEPPKPTSSQLSFRSVEQQQPQQPQPTARRQPPPPVPQDRLSSQSSLNRQNMPPFETTSSSYLSRQQQQQQQQYQPQPSYHEARAGSQQSSIPGSQQGSMRQGPAVTTTTTQYVREVESSRSTSITSTPDVNRVKKQIVVNDPNVNHKDVSELKISFVSFFLIKIQKAKGILLKYLLFQLLLRAIQMATELDPNMEVQKVEISEE